MTTPAQTSRGDSLVSPRPEPASHQHEALIDLKHLIDVARRYWLSILLIPLLFAGTAYYLGQQEIPRYRATALMHVNPTPQKAVKELDDPYNPGFGTSTYYNTQRYLIQSRSLIEQLVSELRLDQVPEFYEVRYTLTQHLLNWRKWPLVGPQRNKKPRPLTDEQKFERAVARATGAASAYLIPGSNLFYVQFASEDPELAAKAANQLADLYIESTLQAKLDVTRRAVSWINEKLSSAASELETSEARLQEFRERESLLNVGGARGLLEDELRNLTDRLRNAELRTGSLETSLAQIKQARDNPESLTNISSLLIDSTVKTAANTFLNAQDQLSGIEERYGARHPRMENARARLNAARETYYEQMRIKTRGLEQEYEIAKKNVQQLRTEVRSARGRIQELDRKTFELKTLQRDVASNQQFYDLFLNRFKETETGASYDEVNARIVEAMKRGTDAVLTGVSGRGTTTRDTFSLLGVTAAIEEANRRCSS